MTIIEQNFSRVYVNKIFTIIEQSMVQFYTLLSSIKMYKTARTDIIKEQKKTRGVLYGHNCSIRTVL